ncbi:hypothetical protein PHACT_02350 [Pseudohongiella acticola]|jgi:uncharacterized protein DUF4329|uniref:DUF4329 domain-containing protein n=1 Tax=Pseudohongiella acticola TaxID=1524254 RepID=A0A1E8CI30_9GAMM|nr:DUF4329 domain-containing protein [Pseudohongiella acticola]OFE12111.1 hypothetical protein PHACT_02350 [Pseudohongiella acticola]
MLSLSTLMMLAGLLVIPGAMAVTESGALIQGPRYHTELAAVRAAVKVYNPTSVARDIEFMGGIYLQEINGQLLYGYTVGAGVSGQDHVTVSFRLPEHSRLVAFWHTHGAQHWTRDYFSRTDTELANEWGIPFYLMNAENELRVYEPGDRVIGRVQARRMGLGDQGGVARGQLLS